MNLNALQTPVRVPKAASTYSPVTNDLDLRSQINTKLIRDGHVEKIQTTLTHALHASSTDWPARIEAYALELLRTKQCTTFPALLDRMVSEVRHDTLVASGDSSSMDNGNGTQASSNSSEDSHTSKKRRTVHMAEMWEDELERSRGGGGGDEEDDINEEEEDMSPDTQRRKRKRRERALRNGRPPQVAERDPSESLAIPQNVIDKGIEVTRECLEHVCEIEDY